MRGCRDVGVMKGGDMVQSDHSGFGPLDVVFVLSMLLLLFGLPAAIAL
jgi:hypothetical protein